MMDEPKRSRAEERAHIELLVRLAEQERWLTTYLERGGYMPPFGPPSSNQPERVIEVDLDVDVVKWFQSLGPVHPARLNAVLKVYALATEARPEED